MLAPRVRDDQAGRVVEDRDVVGLVDCEHGVPDPADAALQDHDAQHAAVEPDNARRFEQFHEAERILCEDELPIIPIFFKRGNYLLNPAFGGVGDNIRDVLPIHRVKKMNRARAGN